MLLRLNRLIHCASWIIWDAWWRGSSGNGWTTAALASATALFCSFLIYPSAQNLLGSLLFSGSIQNLESWCDPFPGDALVIPVDCALPQAVYLYVSWHVITGSGDSSLGSHSEWRRVIKELEGDVYTHKLWFFSWGVDHDNKPWTDSWEPYVKIKCQDDIELMFSGYKKQTRMGFNLWGLNGFLEKERNQRVNQVFTIYIARKYWP